jgi:four helix bundle protein
VQDYKRLKVWEKGHALTIAIYRVTNTFPKHELYGLAGQMQRSASSVPTNIVEGCARSTNAELLKFLFYAQGSLHELEYQLLLSRDLGYVKVEQYESLSADTIELKRMLAALIVKIRRDGKSS